MSQSIAKTFPMTVEKITLLSESLKLKYSINEHNKDNKKIPTNKNNID